MTKIAVDNNVVTLINVFTVRPEQQQLLVDLLVEATEAVMKYQPGFVSANIHKSLDGTRVTNYAQWRSAAILLVVVIIGLLLYFFFIRRGGKLSGALVSLGRDPGPSLFTGLLTRYLLGSQGVLGRAHRHPLEAHLLLCAVVQQGAELDFKPSCRSSRARRDRSAQLSSPR